MSRILRELNYVLKKDNKRNSIILSKKLLVYLNAVVFAFIFTRLVIINAVIPSCSMETTIMTGDRVIANRLEYKFKKPERYDIAVFKAPDKNSALYVKRVVGLPGEKLEIKNNQIYINGSILESNFINGKMQTENAVYYIPQKGSAISSYTNFISNIWLYDANGDGLFDEDCYFMMGDNRNNSYDSRFWNNKFVPKSYFKGKVFLRYFPFNKIKIYD